MSFSKLTSKAKIKIMKESQEPEPVDEPGTDSYLAKQLFSLLQFQRIYVELD